MGNQGQVSKSVSHSDTVSVAFITPPCAMPMLKMAAYKLLYNPDIYHIVPLEAPHESTSIFSAAAP